VEAVAGDLVKRHYYDPHWEKDRAMVAAYERVILYGLTLVSRRRVDYGTIDPKEARRIFIRGALVAGEYETRAPFFAHNRRLLADIEALEHKARRRDVLVDEEAIFAFYDALIPGGRERGRIRGVARGGGAADPKSPPDQELLMRHGASVSRKRSFRSHRAGRAADSPIARAGARAGQGDGDRAASS
jgi:ATP-dependent helicase HrpA